MGGKTCKDCVPVLVGKDGVFEKILVPIKVIHHPSIVHLLEQSEKEFGYPQRLLKISYDSKSFNMVIKNIYSLDKTPKVGQNVKILVRRWIRSSNEHLRLKKCGQ